jgi:hypothetical protein
VSIRVSPTLLLFACAPAATPEAIGESTGATTTTSATDSTTTVVDGSSSSEVSTQGTSIGSSDEDSTSSTSAGASSSSTGGCVERLPPIDDVPELLSQTGLYDDIVAGSIAGDVQTFAPRFPLWSDGADKQRWVWLPACEPIDTSDMDHWELPVGTRLWKQFTRDGVRIETRLVTRTGPGATQWRLATYVWNGDDAEHVTTGVDDALGTMHDVPDEVQCTACHRQSWRVLGFSAIQLAHDGPGTTLQSLLDDGALSDAPVQPVAVPGDTVAQAALGMLHSNCGSCHSDDGVPFVELELRLRTTDTAVEDTQAWQSAVGVPALMFECDGCDLIEPGVPESSALVLRMLERGPDSEQMPPLATELVDETGIEALGAWILSMPAG